MTQEESSAPALVTQARTQIKAKEFDQALENLNQALEMEPENVQAYVIRATVLAEQHHFDDAIADCQRGLEINPQQRDAWFLLGNLYGHQKRYPEAMEAFDQAAALNHAHASKLAERLHKQLDNRDQKPAAAGAVAAGAAVAAAASQSSEADDTEASAAEVAEAAPVADPADDQESVEDSVSEEDTAASLANDEGVDDEPELVEEPVADEEILDEDEVLAAPLDGEPAEDTVAEEPVELAAATIDIPADASIEDLLQLSLVSLMRHEYENCVAASTAGIEHNWVTEEQAADFYTYRGLAQFRLENAQLALNDLGRALDLDNHHVDAYIYRGQIHLALKHKDEAMHDAEQARSYAEDTDIRSFMLLGDVFLLFDEREQALEQYLQAIHLAPRHPQALFTTGALYYQANNLLKARQYLDHAAEYGSQDAIDLLASMNAAEANQTLRPAPLAPPPAADETTAAVAPDMSAAAAEPAEEAAAPLEAVDELLDEPVTGLALAEQTLAQFAFAQVGDRDGEVLMAKKRSFGLGTKKYSKTIAKWRAHQLGGQATLELVPEPSSQIVVNEDDDGQFHVALYANDQIITEATTAAEQSALAEYLYGLVTDGFLAIDKRRLMYTGKS